MENRLLVPEILDELDGSDERAIRSRRDLRLINRLMGNERWILRELKKLARSGSVAELGAGGGELLAAIAKAGWDCGGFDLQPKPEHLKEETRWTTGDFLKNLQQDSSPIVVGSLILHHFEEQALRQLGQLLEEREVLIFAEPWRVWPALVEGALLFPVINEVTRHDMIVSIKAGFRKGELAEALGLQEGWQWQEQSTSRGGLRSIAVKTKP